MQRWLRFRRYLGLQLLALYLLLIIPFLLTLWIFDGLVGQRNRAYVLPISVCELRSDPWIQENPFLVTKTVWNCDNPPLD